MKYLFIALFLACPTFLFSKEKSKKHATVFMSWGWNRAFFTHSNIHFKGADYDFHLRETVAKDRQSPFDANVYFNPKVLSIPQYNFAIGIMFPNYWSATIGQDHMKYVVKQGSSAILNGSIHNGSLYDGNYVERHITIDSKFLQYEHTNGLNYVHVTVNRDKDWFENLSKKIKFKTIFGINAGLLVPKSDVKLMDYAENDQWHIAGYGVAMNAGLKVTCYKYFFLRFDTKDGIINMPDVLVRGSNSSDRAKQHFGFFEFFGSFGFQYPF